jgi:hypothetical protein
MELNIKELENMTVGDALTFLATKEKKRITEEFEKAKEQLAAKFNKITK